MRDAIGAGDRDQFGIRIHRRPRLDIGRVFAHFAGVPSGADGVDLDQAERSGRCDETGIKMLAVEVNHFVGLGLNGFFDGFNFAVRDQHLARRECRAGDGVDGRAGEQNGFGSERTDTREAR